MKKNIPLTLLILLTLTACNPKPNSTESSENRVVQEDKVDAKGVHSMQVSKAEQTITYKGKEYHSQVHRKPDESLPRVKDEQGNVYADNTISLKLTSGNQKVIDKVFTKQSFSSLVNESFMRKAILEGMVFDKTTSKGFVYAVSVSYPQTDLYIPISVTISPDGKISMAKEELMEEIYEEE